MKRVLFLFLLFSLAGCAKKPDGVVLARFDGSAITDKEFTRKVQSLPKTIRPLAYKRKKDFIEDIAAEHFLLKEAERLNLGRDKDVKEILESARKKILVAKLVDREVDKKISLEPQEASDYYESHKEEFMSPLHLRVSHIVVKTREEATALQKLLQAGGDFEEIARQNSLDTTAIRGGDVGFFQKGQFVPEFEAAAFNLKKGELSDIVQTQFGYHLIKLTDRVEASLKDFKTVKPLVEQRLRNEKRTKAFKAYVSKLKGDTKITFEDKAIESLAEEEKAL